MTNDNRQDIYKKIQAIRWIVGKDRTLKQMQQLIRLEKQLAKLPPSPPSPIHELGRFFRA